ncbi:Ig-like domain-containing protein [Haloarcula sp. S1CR25-12]|uniref:Ig-like domain-containing protein n=1 Tax=Haloarcula saliterrae TaxID=2950534 RepID=A0ABU2FAC5_9EURY|nr:Ig-like domain-containing protein [Haloarcula sp. S1CR25-12]MDS0259232.1 Ig-like domain-containing protein [Haloarcula sp. S1CR25-12]
MKVRAVVLSALMVFSVFAAPGIGATQAGNTDATQAGNTDLTAAGNTNAAPTANPDTVTAGGNTTTVIQTDTLLANDTDPDGDTLIVTGAVSQPSEGTLTFTGDAFEYTAGEGFFGNDTFVYEVEDGSGATDIATVTVDVQSVSNVTDVNVSDLSGSGTDDDPYVITNASELQSMEDDTSASYVLGNDVDASETAKWNARKGFDPVGTASSDSKFSGTFDGEGHTISGLTIDRPGEDDVGLFASSSGTVRNLRIVAADITGEDNVGGIVGAVELGDLANLSTSGSIDGDTFVGGVAGDVADREASVRHISSSATVNGTESVGGLVGENRAPLRNSTSSATVRGTERVGGIVGYDGGVRYDTTDLRNVSSTATVSGDETVGGVAGETEYGKVINSTSEATVTGDTQVGGLVGTASRLFGSVRGSSSSGSVNGSNNVGGLVGLYRAPIVDSRSTATVTGSENVGGLVGASSTNRYYARPSVENSSASATVTGSTNVGGLAGTTGSELRNVSADGTVRGNTSVGGLVGSLGGDARYATANATVTGTQSVGGLVGTIGSSSARVVDAYATGSVTGSRQVGGLVGTIDDNATDVLNRTYAVANVSGDSETGGLVGAVGSTGTVYSYWDTQATGQADSAAGTGLTTAQMTGTAAPTNMTGFDFVVTWETRPDGYPVLSPGTRNPNTAPTARDDTLSTTENTPLTIDGATLLANDDDPDGNRLSVVGSIGEPANGTLTFDNGSFEYAPDDGFTGEDSFVYEMQDSFGATDTATVTITVGKEADNSAPTASDDSVNTTENATLAIDTAELLANDTDPDGDTLTVTGVSSQPANGTASLDNGTVEYTPAAGFTGEDSFDYRIEDGAGAADTATVFITVEPSEPEGPVLSVGDATVTANDTATVNVSLSAVPDGLSGFNVSVTAGDANVTSIEGAAVDPTFTLSAVTLDSAASATLVGTDVNKSVDPGDANVTLGSVTIDGVGAGTTDLSLTVDQIDDDSGDLITPVTEGGSVTVERCGPVRPSLPAPTDPDGDGDYEDLNGNGRLDFQDVVLLFDEQDSLSATCYDFNENGRTDYDDVRALFDSI